MASTNKRIYCKFCNFFTRDIATYASHLESTHSDLLPEGISGYQAINFIKTGKLHGTCIICKSDTDWNDVTHKYKRFCNNPKCKETYIKTFKERMIGKYGKTTLLNDPEQQKKMLANRSISGTYLWSDHVHTTTYTGSYEKSFLEFIDKVMDYDASDIIMPSPHTYYYEYEGKQLFYIPDAYIPSLNLEIEIKDGGDNPNMHHKIQDVDKVKEKLKDDVVISSKINYLKIYNKENNRFLKYLNEMNDNIYNNDKEKQIVMI